MAETHADAYTMSLLANSHPMIYARFVGPQPGAIAVSEPADEPEPQDEDESAIETKVVAAPKKRPPRKPPATAEVD